MNERRRDDDLIREVEELRGRLLDLADEESAITRDRIADDLTVLLRDLRANREQIDASLAS